ncbi:hypothetical protein A3C96_03090 [Candidatus Uhrbacteria bacterium RIFCSPHIGHO2_02_FULL_60_10]|uniref:GIY-YIG domain-containing protein n=1 Tax=Candidatus Uhrbacteria bacterium RIFCSPHIGHO2_02_FULL_60_10 TaxID=1802392 RepID=A0A1F7U7F1_9BACT|nr:MAG: hypothetical protein A3C96_03090 [Candidatus Uhrbacteria bacterium RIFCSPHIGHO2_02_FULL_60_10]
MYFTYIIRSGLDGRYYYGSASDVHARLAAHNSGSSAYTKKFRPWYLVWFGAFGSKQKAEEFERYLKCGFGHAFSRKRLL